MLLNQRFRKRDSILKVATARRVVVLRNIANAIKVECNAQTYALVKVAKTVKIT